MGKVDPEVAVEVLDEPRVAPRVRLLPAAPRRRWWYSVRLHWPLTHVRLLFVRYPE